MKPCAPTRGRVFAGMLALILLLGAGCNPMTQSGGTSSASRPASPRQSERDTRPESPPPVVPDPG